MLKSLSGAGGGKGGGGGDFVQKPDNLRSADTFEGLLGLCSGPIKGPVHGMKSIRINGTPIQGADDEDNFEDVVAVFADGDPLKHPQKATLKLGSAGAPQNVGVDISNLNEAGTPGEWLTRTLTNMNAEAIDLRFIVNQLYGQTKKGIFENTLHLEIQMKPSGTATWINPFSPNGNTLPEFEEGGYVTGKGGLLRLFVTMAGYERAGAWVEDGTLAVRGKTTSPVVYEVRVKVPNEGTYADRMWDIRVRLIEPESVDDDPNFEKRLVQWESLAAVYSSVLGDHEDWRGLAWLQIYGKASDNFNGLPAVDGIYETKIVSVPNAEVYDPVTRTYTGATWDGSWAKSYTNDPAWCIADLISDSISGVAAFVPGAFLNKWDALELSKWCSEQVPDGAGGTHPRFSLNIFIDQSQRSDELVRYLAGATGSTAWDEGNGRWRLKVDKPQTPVAIFTPENIEGEFNYSHTDVDTRFNEITVAFLNEEFDYREDWIRVRNEADIAAHGRRPTRLVAVGCTNRQQALRWAVQRLRTNVNEFRMATFVTNRQGKYIERFDHILVADNSLNNMADDNIRRTTGRIVHNDGTTIRVRDPIRLEVGVTYALRTTMPNPAYNPEPTAEPEDTWQQPTITVTRQILNDAGQRGDVTTLYLDEAFPASIAENAVVALEATGLPAIPRVYRVLDLDYNQDNERVAISAIEVDTGKWAAAEAATDDNIQQLFDDTIPPPTAPVGGMFTLSTFVSEYGVKNVLTANWDRPDVTTFDKFRIEYRHNNGPWQDMGTTRDDFYEMQEPEPGQYDFRIYALARRGFASLPLEGSYEVLETPNAVAVSSGPAVMTGKFDYTGTVAQDLPKSYTFTLGANGINLADVVWDYRVTDGGVNGVNTLSGWQIMPVTGGVGTFTFSSIEVDDSVIEVRGTTMGGLRASKSIAVNKSLALPAGSGKQTSGFGTIGTPFTSFVAISDELEVDVPTGGGDVQVLVNLQSLMPVSADNSGPWNVEYKVQRLIGGVWTDVGVAQNSNPDAYTDYVETS